MAPALIYTGRSSATETSDSAFTNDLKGKATWSQKGKQAGICSTSSRKIDSKENGSEAGLIRLKDCVERKERCSCLLLTLSPTLNAFPSCRHISIYIRTSYSSAFSPFDLCLVHCSPQHRKFASCPPPSHQLIKSYPKASNQFYTSPHPPPSSHN
jgi:hypothetical protein